MNAYIYNAALYCEPCGDKIRADLTKAGKAPAKPDDEHTYDSGDFPKGPYPRGGGESDCPQHCDACGEFLENPLTTDGMAYVVGEAAEAIEAVLRGERRPIDATSPLGTWLEFYDVGVIVGVGSDADVTLGAKEIVR